jgi:hypothetical protein
MWTQLHLCGCTKGWIRGRNTSASLTELSASNAYASQARMETVTGRKFFAKSDIDGRIVEIREYLFVSEPFADITIGRTRRVERIILKTFPDEDLVVRVEGDPKAFKILKTNEIVREI